MKRLTERRPNGVIRVDFIEAKESSVSRLAAIEDILKVVFQPGYDVVTIYNPPDEDGLYTMTVTGVISKEEYEAALKARE